MSQFSVPYVQHVTREVQAFQRFCQVWCLTDSVESVSLYLTSCVDRGDSGVAVRKRLSLLDVDRRSRGLEGMGGTPLMRTFLRGMYRTAALPEVREWDPLYVEHVRQLVDAVDRPTTLQLRNAALIAIHRMTGMDAVALSALQWGDVRLGAARVRIQTTTRSRNPVCFDLREGASGSVSATAVLAKLRQAQGQAIGPVFGHIEPVQVRRILAWGHDQEPSLVINEMLQLSRRQMRDRTLLLLASGAALTVAEVRLLHLDHLVVTDAGLVVRPPWRQRPVLVRNASEARYSLAMSWVAWRASAESFKNPLGLAMPELQGQTPQQAPMSPRALQRVVSLAVERAGLKGSYAFSSLRAGGIRSDLREGVPLYKVARRAGLRRLATVGAYQRRESILNDNAAMRVGL